MALTARHCRPGCEDPPDEASERLHRAVRVRRLRPARLPRRDGPRRCPRRRPGTCGQAVRAAGGARHLCPYHYEYEEEWLLVLDGIGRRPHTRRRARSSATGDIAAFPAGPDGAHKVMNHSDGTAHVLMFSSAREPAVAVYPGQRQDRRLPGPPRRPRDAPACRRPPRLLRRRGLATAKNSHNSRSFRGLGDPDDLRG